MRTTLAVEPATFRPLRLRPAEFARFAEFVKQELGINLTIEKAPMLEGRLSRRMRELEMTSATEYTDYLFHSPNASEEKLEFINSITTNKTDFFREPKHFEYLVNAVVPQWCEASHEGPFKLWCAGCSSGEEPYSLARVLTDFAQRTPGFDFALLATDVSTRVLDHARSGIYDHARVDPVPLPMRRQYLMRSRVTGSQSVRIAPALRRKISFQRLNFMEDDYSVRTQFDVIFFRNVLIYFEKAVQEQVVCKIVKNLKPGGCLFIGHSESLAGLNVPLDALGAATFRKRSPRRGAKG